MFNWISQKARSNFSAVIISKELILVSMPLWISDSNNLSKNGSGSKEGEHGSNSPLHFASLDDWSFGNAFFGRM